MKKHKLKNGVRVNMPQQKKKGKNIETKVDDSLPTKEIKKDKNFTPTRDVINFEVLDKETGKPLTKFNPAFELGVEYIPDDYKAAKRKGKKLRLAYWHETKKRWVRFTKKKHDFKLVPTDPKKPDQGGEGVAQITDWGDPQLDWGD